MGDVLGPASRVKMTLPKPVGPGTTPGKKGKKKLLKLLNPKGAQLGKGTMALRQLRTITELPEKKTRTEQCLVFYPYRIDSRRSGPTSSDDESRTQVEKGAFEDLKEGEPVPDLESKEEHITVSTQRRGRRGRRVVLDEGENPDILDDTAQSDNTSDDEQDLLVDYDIDGEPESYPDYRGRPVMIVTQDPKGEEITATICTGQLQALVAEDKRASLPPEPKTVKEALPGPYKDEWHKAIQAEYDTLMERDTWELAELPPGRRAIGVKWLLKIKTNAKGELEKFKARLVAKGFSQVKGIDFNDTYAPVSRFTTLRVLMAMTAHDDLIVTQLDVKNAFLYGR